MSPKFGPKPWDPGAKFSSKNYGSRMNPANGCQWPPGCSRWVGDCHFWRSRTNNNSSYHGKILLEFFGERKMDGRHEFWRFTQELWAQCLKKFQFKSLGLIWNDEHLGRKLDRLCGKQWRNWRTSKSCGWSPWREPEPSFLGSGFGIEENM